jgi:vacuolar-type H+-ATPase subunit I/STV1
LTIALLLLAAAVVFAAAFTLGRRRAAQRERARTLAQVLDAADALEARLRTARAEIEAIAGTEDNPVRDALQEMLRQRLWLQQHGDAATLEQLSQVRDSIQAGAERIDQQLARIERARAPTVH